MTRADRIEAILKSAEWWDTEVVVGAARSWFLDWRQQALRIPASQWGAVHRLGMGALKFQDYADAWEEFLEGKKDPDGTRRSGVKDRDKRKQGWAQPVLADDLWMMVGHATEAQDSERMRRFERDAQELGPRAEQRLREWRKLKQARLFVDSLVTMVKTELSAREGA